MRLRVHAVQRFCLHDGPGIRTVVFLQGCPLRCWWCQNPDSREIQGAASERDAAALAAEVSADARYWRASGGGVTISGGEPLLQSQALAGFLAELSHLGADRCIETSGAVSRDRLIAVSPHVDRWLFDLKAASPERLAAGTRGADVEQVTGNLHWLLAHTTGPVTIRVPLIAGFNLDRDELRKLADAAAKLPRRTPVELLPGHALGACRGGADPTPSPEQITLAADTFARKGLETTVRW